ncbi:hypothetical protein BDN72DRAFT_833963 [Pluteus cervinus]|uniref:Uncharacterized protein n=1 Tax=Pluteus cervinus TaxID=181527 RepID=A0ACD3BAF8_9AGAR|nr:hypothetical protein BDN72DRAFT_833963 [Pluteus cervinus]
MDDADDYFTDDLVLDEQALAVLDQTEAAFFTRVNKRQRTSDGWKPGPGFYSSTYDDDGEDMPEISVRRDGTYGISNARNATQNTPAGRAAGNGAIASQPRVVPPQPRPVHAQASSRSSSAIVNRPSLPTRLARTAPERSTNVRPNPVEPQHDNGLQEKVSQLESQFAKIQADFEVEKRVKMAKEGEVTILRQNMAKVAQEHSAQLLNLQATKENELSKQIQVQKELKEEIERLKTQLTFKQAESEASARKPPPSARSRRIRDVPVTPMRQRDYGDDEFPSFGHPQTTPRHTQPEFPFKDPLPIHNTKATPSTRRTTSMLPGFQNSFTTSTQLQAPVKSRRARDDLVSQPPPSIRRKTQSSPASSPPLAQQPDQDDRANMVVDHDVLDIPQNDTNFDSSPKEGDMELDMEEDFPLEIIDPVTRRDPSEEFFGTLLTHKVRGSRTATLHVILNTSLSSPAPTLTYSKACDGILNTIANHLSNKDFTTAMDNIARSFLTMSSTLRNKESADALIALLNLATSLIRSAPMFAISLLSSEDMNSPCIVLALCDVIRLDLSSSSEQDQASRLMKELLYFLEALSSNPADALVPKFLPLISTPEVLTTLLNKSYPNCVLSVSCQVLAQLATFSQLAQAFLSLSRNDTSSGSNTQEPTRPHLEQLCSYLIDTDRPDSQTLKLSILQLFSTLSLASQESLLSLRSHPLLIPSVVAFISHVASPMWEDESSVSNPEHTLQTIQTINHSIILLHHLVFGVEPAFNLGRRLYNVPYRKFTNILHLFMVTFGRLSYADTPDWIEPGFRIEFERTIELSRDLLESVVDGTESDSIWAAFQPENDEDQPTDQGDIEARMLNEIEDS